MGHFEGIRMILATNEPVEANSSLSQSVIEVCHPEVVLPSLKTYILSFNLEVGDIVWDGKDCINPQCFEYKVRH